MDLKGIATRGGWLLAALVTLAPPAAAQSADAMCRAALASERLEKQALEQVKDQHEAGLARLPAQARQQAWRNLYRWYWRTLREIEANERDLMAECGGLTRMDPDRTKMSPAPTRPRRPIGRRPRRQPW